MTGPADPEEPAPRKTAANKAGASKTAPRKTAASKTAANKAGASKTAPRKAAASKTAANKTGPSPAVRATPAEAAPIKAASGEAASSTAGQADTLAHQRTAERRAAADRRAAERRTTERRTPAERRLRSLDPQGRRALFETPVSAARDTIRSGRPREGKDALYSTGPRQSGTVVVTCSGCQARSRINLTDLGLRWLTGTAWLPGRRNSHWMRCPSCNRRTWCAIGWQE